MLLTSTIHSSHLPGELVRMEKLVRRVWPCLPSLKQDWWTRAYDMDTADYVVQAYVRAVGTYIRKIALHDTPEYTWYLNGHDIETKVAQDVVPAGFDGYDLATHTLRYCPLHTFSGHFLHALRRSIIKALQIHVQEKRILTPLHEGMTAEQEVWYLATISGSFGDFTYHDCAKIPFPQYVAPSLIAKYSTGGMSAVREDMRVNKPL